MVDNSNSNQYTQPKDLNGNHSSPELVMVHFQQSLLQMTQSFLATQQSVMVCYLETMRCKQSTASRASNSPDIVYPRTGVWLARSPATLPALDSMDPEIQSSTIAVAPQAVSFAMPPPQQEAPPDVDDEALVLILLNLISDRTGYPIDMLESGLDLESDLGVDSIKRIEILNNFQKVLPNAKRIQLENSMEHLVGARTIDQIVEWIKQPNGNAGTDILLSTGAAGGQ